MEDLREFELYCFETLDGDNFKVYTHKAEPLHKRFIKMIQDQRDSNSRCPRPRTREEQAFIQDMFFKLKSKDPIIIQEAVVAIHLYMSTFENLYF